MTTTVQAANSSRCCRRTQWHALYPVSVQWLWPTAAWNSITSALNDKHPDSLLNKEDQLLIITDHREGNGHCRVAAAEDTVYSPEYVSASQCSICERLFSGAGPIMNSHCTDMSDKLLFEQLVFYGRRTSLCTVCNDFYTFTNTDYLHSLPI